MEAKSGPFQKGERLTAEKLNDLAAGMPISVTGGALTQTPRSAIVHVDQPENIYIKLTGKNGSSPIKYAWKQVVRLASGAWQDTPRTANHTDDYAIELNNSNLSTSDGYIYRAERSPHTGEWLFFLRRNRTPAYSIRITPYFLSSGAGQCKTEISLMGLTSKPAFSTSAPDEFRIASVTLRMKDYNNNWTVLKTWTDQSDPTWGNYTYTPPYTPSPSQPMTFELSGETASGTLLGQLHYSCPPTSLCGTALTTDFYDSAGYPSPYYYQAVSANITSNTTTVTSNTTNIALAIRPKALSQVVLPSGSMTGPTEYKYKMNWVGVTFPSQDVLDFINAEFSSQLVPFGRGASGFATSRGWYGGALIERQGQVNFGLGYTVAEDWSTVPVPDWPSPYPAYSFGLLTGWATVRVSTSSKTISTTSNITPHYGSAATSFPEFDMPIPTPKTLTTPMGGAYDLQGANAKPSGTC